VNAPGSDTDQTYRRRSAVPLDDLVRDAANGAGDVVATHDLGHQIDTRLAPKLVIVPSRPHWTALKG
jgi:hypothetical protein